MKQCTLETFKTLIHDGDVIGLAALTVSNLPTALLYGLAEQYDETASPAHLTFMLANDISTGGHTIDLDHFIQRNMVDRIIMSIMTASPLTAQAIQSNQVEAYFLPQGVIATHYRQTNHLTPGIITKIGLHTHIDPRYKGGKANEKTQESLVSLINIEGEEFLHYHLPAVNIALLRGTYADEKGNIYMDEEAHLGESYSVALNAKAHHGTVVVQVKAIVDSHQQNPNHVFIPGSLVDYIYVVEDIAYHRQLIQTQYSPALSGQMRVESLPEPPLPFSIRKLILRRAAQFLTTGDTISIGFGINNELTNLLHEERVEHLVQPIMDIGIFGGFIGSRDYYGMNFNVDARMRHDLTWDFIYNSGISIAFMSFAEVDQYGHINVSYFGHRMNGCGGFIDISQSVQKIVFSGTLVARGQLSVSNQALHVEQQGQTQKFVSNVSNIDFNADYAKSLQQEIYYVTERAVFQLTQDGLMLIEIAPGLDIERDVIAQMGFRPLVSKNLKTIDTSIYHHVWGALLDRIQTEA